VENDQSKHLEVPWIVTFLLGPLFLGAGILLLGTSFGYVPAEYAWNPIHTWMIPLGGVTFMCMGMWLFLVHVSRKAAQPFGFVAVFLFIGAFNWVAFGPGERQFTAQMAINSPLESTGHIIPDIQGRIIFGIFAGGMDALILCGWYLALRKKKNDGR